MSATFFLSKADFEQDMNIENDKRADFLRQPTNTQSACYDVINDVPYWIIDRLWLSQLTTCWTHRTVVSSEGSALPILYAAFY